MDLALQSSYRGGGCFTGASILEFYPDGNMQRVNFRQVIPYSILPNGQLMLGGQVNEAYSFHMPSNDVLMFGDVCKYLRK